VKSRIPIVLLIVSLCVSALLLVRARRPSGGDTPAGVAADNALAPHMATMQMQAHKLGLSIQARNQALAAFYLDELEETAETVEQSFPLHGDVPVAELIDTMLQPSLPPLDNAVAAADWPAATAAYESLISACNDCHGAANHEFVAIVPPVANPFNQTFSPR
jgi:hypothetical protein